MKSFALLLSLTLAACGGSGGTPPTIDAPTGSADAPPGTADAPTGSTIDAPTGTTPDAPTGTTIDASGPPLVDGGPGVSCGTMSCSATQTCCVMAAMGGGAPTYSCLDPGTMCMGGTIACDGPEDCGGNACCASVMGMSGSAMCGTAPMMCMGFAAQLCHADADCPAGMGGTAGHCCPPTAMIPYSICAFGGFCPP
jgi:hypothetical protein